MPFLPVASRAVRLAGVAALLFLPAAPAVAQISGQQNAAELLEMSPELQQRLRSQINQSGLSEEQIRERLRQAGYPEGTLDQYLSGARPGESSADPSLQIDAVRQLGLVGDAEADSLSMLLEGRGFRPEVDPYVQDSIRADSLGIPWTRPLEVFGLDVFKRRTTEFRATLTGPVDPNYRLGPGDRIAVILTGEVQRALSLDVSRDGFIVVPQVGQLYVANLTMAQVEAELFTRFRRVYSGLSRGPDARTQLVATVSRLRNIQVFVTGDVVRPGAYQMSAAGSALTALYAAGGPTNNGSLRRVEIRRGGALVDSFDIYDYLLAGVNRAAVSLQSGDVVFVPVHGPRVKVAGEVVRPAIYEL